MAIGNLPPVDSASARRVWEEYQHQHDVSSFQGQTAGIEPTTGRVWLGASIEKVIEQRDRAGCDLPLYFVRIGSPAYYRKGGRR